MALSPYAAKVKADGAYLHFPMSETSGDLVDSIRGVRMPGGGDRAYHQRGKVGLGWMMQFNDGYFSTNSSEFARTGNTFSLEIWAKFTLGGSNRRFLMHRRGCYSMSITPDHTMEFTAVSHLGTQIQIETDDLTDYADGIMHHFVARYDGGSLKLFIDGVQAASETVIFSVDWVQGAGGIRTALGTGIQSNNSTNPTQRYIGALDEFAFYKLSLTLEQIQDHYLLGTMPTHELATGMDMPLKFAAKLGTVNLHMEETMPLKMGIDFNTDLSNVMRGQPWWDYSYPYRRVLSYTAPPVGLQSGHPVYVTLTKDIINQGKAAADLEDIAVAYLASDVPQTWVQLPVNVTSTETEILINFPLYEDLGPDETSLGRYFIYYGNKDLFAIEMPYDYYDPWFVYEYPDSALVDYTNPGKDWKDGKAENYQAKMTMFFYGDRFRLRAKVGPDQGIAEIQVNNGSWNMIDLFSLNEDEGFVYQVENLPAGGNYLRYRVSGQANPAARGKGINFTRIDYAKHSTFTDVREEADDSKVWGSTLGGMING